LGTDLQKLRAEDTRIRSHQAGPAGLVGKGIYATDLKKVDGLIDGLDGARSAFGILKKQMDFYDKYLQVEKQFKAVIDQAGGGDVGGAVGAIPALKTQGQAIVTASSDSSVPPQFKQQAAGLLTFAGDFEAVLAAAQAHDSNAYTTADNKLQGDANLLDFDSAAFDKWETDLLAPYRSRYDRGLTTAGFKVENP